MVVGIGQGVSFVGGSEIMGPGHDGVFVGEFMEGTSEGEVKVGGEGSVIDNQIRPVKVRFEEVF